MVEKQIKDRPKLGQNFRFGFYDIPAKERMRAIAGAGFDDVMMHWDEHYADTDMMPDKLFDTAVQCGLAVRTVHFPQQDAHLLWTEGESGESYTDFLIRVIKEVGARQVSHLVLHTTRRLITPPPGPIGLERVRRALDEAEKQNVCLAFENTRFLNYNAYLYDHFDSPFMAFCFDSGHAHCYTPGQDPLGRFSDRMVTMHLHDNFGAEQGDLHLPIGEGNIDFDALFKRLKALDPPCYNLESYRPKNGAYAKMDLETFLSACFQTLCRYVLEAQ